MSGSIVDVLTVSSSDVLVECPHCGNDNEGFVNDPRGGTFECDSCGESFSINEGAKIKVW